jgi:lysophospholipase L1-like esterase
VDVNQPRTIWLAGDSTVAGGNTPCPTGWGKGFEELFEEPITVINSGAGGRSVRTWMYQVQAEMGADGECVLALNGDGQPALQDRWQAMLDGMAEGDTLLIQFGINDGSPTCDRHVGIEAFIESYGVLAEAAKTRGTQPVFITPVSMIACDGTTPIGSRGGYVDATFDAGERYDVPVIDLHQLSVDLYAELGFCPVPGGDVSASTGGPVGDFFCDDHTHFSQSGAPQIADLVAQALSELDLPIALYLR